MRITKTKLGVAAAATVVVALAGTAAYAYFATSGSGTGSAGAATPVGVTISSNTVSGLYPVTSLSANGTGLSGTFSNSNPYSVTIPALYATITDVSGGLGTCATSNFSVTGGNLLVSSPIAVPAATGPTAGTATWSAGQIALINQPNTDQSGCEGATVSLSFSTVGP